MHIANWIFVSVATVLLAYQLRFSEATLVLGRELSDTRSATGVQNAIAPQWQTNFGLVAFSAMILSVGIIRWESGWFSGLKEVTL